MALSKVQVLELFVRIVEPDVSRQRMLQMYGVLSVEQQDQIYALIKADVLFVLTGSKARLQVQDSNVTDALTLANDQIDDVENAS